MPEYDCVLVAMKMKAKSSLFIPCMKSACNSKSHSKDRYWWINPELRPNIKNTIVSKKLQNIVMGNKSQKQGQSNPVSDLTSAMTALNLI